MLRGMQKLCGSRGLVQPYVCSYQLCYSHTMPMTTENVQKLPTLPVPKLEDTIRKYLRTVRPHLSDEEFAVTSKLAQEFAAKTGVGVQLQSFLLEVFFNKVAERGSDPRMIFAVKYGSEIARSGLIKTCLLEKRAEKHLNWLEEWWLNSAYLEYRDPVVVYSSPGLVFPFRDFKSQTEQLQYAAKTLLAALDYKSLIDNDKIPVEMMGKAQLDMAQYKKIFGTCRLPGDKRDRLSFNGDSTHVTVMHNNHIFRVELCGEDNVVLNEDQIVQQLQRVIEMSNNRTNDAIGLLTSDNRDNWAKAYEILKKDHVTKESLADVERSLFILCLDSRVGLHNEPDANARRNVAAAQTIHGGGSTSNGGNRWFDKTIQFIVGADGVAGLTYEHSPAEGQPIAVMTDYIINYIDRGKAEKKRPSSKAKEPVHLKFNINSEVQGLIKEAAANLDKLVCNLELNCFKFDMYGKNFIKSQKLSPDSYLQMAMQLAFFRLHKTPGAHYESAATRMYVGGRTETIRSCSIESIEFAKAMLNPQVSSKDKVMALQRAIKGHKDYTVQALQGLGVDRHLLGLKLTAIENGIEVPKLYSDPGYLKSSRMRISTSQVACKCDGFMCYGPLVADGYATCYNPRDADVNLATSALRHPASSARRYGAALDQSLRDMHDVLLQTLPSKL